MQHLQSITARELYCCWLKEWAVCSWTCPLHLLLLPLALLQACPLHWSCCWACPHWDPCWTGSGPMASCDHQSQAMTSHPETICHDGFYAVRALVVLFIHREASMNIWLFDRMQVTIELTSSFTASCTWCFFQMHANSFNAVQNNVKNSWNWLCDGFVLWHSSMHYGKYMHTVWVHYTHKQDSCTKYTYASSQRLGCLGSCMQICIHIQVASKYFNICWALVSSLITDAQRVV